MKIAVFAKKRQTKDGKPFWGYIAKLKKKDGEELTVSVKFREDCGNPKAESCPCYIEVDKKSANLTAREVVNDEIGEIIISRTLWVSAWKFAGEYVDHSLDDFE